MRVKNPRKPHAVKRNALLSRASRKAGQDCISLSDEKARAFFDVKCIARNADYLAKVEHPFGFPIF